MAQQKYRGNSLDCARTFLDYVTMIEQDGINEQKGRINRAIDNKNEKVVF